jgi:hypothetical protein
VTLLEEIQQRLLNLPPEKQIEVLDFIAFLQEWAQVVRSASAESERGQRIKAALQTLADLGTFADIVDSVAWQKQTRLDVFPVHEEMIQTRR